MSQGFREIPRGRIGKARIERRIKTLSAGPKRDLGKIPGVKVHPPVDPYPSGELTAFSMAGVDPAMLVDFLREMDNLDVRAIGSKDAGTLGVRVSTPIHISTREVDMVVDDVTTLMAHRG